MDFTCAICGSVITGLPIRHHVDTTLRHRDKKRYRQQLVDADRQLAQDLLPNTGEIILCCSNTCHAAAHARTGDIRTANFLNHVGSLPMESQIAWALVSGKIKHPDLYLEMGAEEYKKWLHDKTMQLHQQTHRKAYAAATRKWYKLHKEEALEKSAAKYKESPEYRESMKQHAHQYYIDHQDARLEYNKQYHIEHKEQRNAYSIEWMHSHREDRRIYDRSEERKAYRRERAQRLRRHCLICGEKENLVSYNESQWICEFCRQSLAKIG